MRENVEKGCELFRSGALWIENNSSPGRAALSAAPGDESVRARYGLGGSGLGGSGLGGYALGGRGLGGSGLGGSGLGGYALGGSGLGGSGLGGSGPRSACATVAWAESSLLGWKPPASTSR